MGTVCLAKCQTNIVQKLNKEFRQVSNRINFLQRKIEQLNRSQQIDEAYIKNAELSGLQWQKEKLKDQLLLVNKLYQQQVDAGRQVFILRNIDQNQKEILRLDLKNTTLDDILKDQQKIEAALKKLEDTLRQLNEGMGNYLQLPFQIQPSVPLGMKIIYDNSISEQQTFLEKILNAFNSFDKVIEKLKVQLSTQEERSNLLSNLIDQEKSEKKQIINQYQIEINNINDNKLKEKNQQIEFIQMENQKFQQQIQTYKQKFHEQQTDMSKQQTEIQNLQRKNQTILISYDELKIVHNQKLLDNQEKKEQEIQNLNKEFEIKINQLIKEVETHKLELDKQKKENDDLYEKLLKQNQNLSQNHIQTIKIQNQMEKEKKDLQQVIENLNSEKNQLQNQIQLVQKRHTEEEKQICKHQSTQLEKQDQKLKILEEKNKELEQQIKALKQQNLEVNSQKDDLYKKNQNYEQKLSILQSKCQNLEIEITECKKESVSVQQKDHEMKNLLNLHEGLKQKQSEQSLEIQSLREQLKLDQSNRIQRKNTNMLQSQFSQSQQSEKSPYYRSKSNLKQKK